MFLKPFYHKLLLSTHLYKHTVLFSLSTKSEQATSNDAIIKCLTSIHTFFALSVTVDTPVLITYALNPPPHFNRIISYLIEYEMHHQVCCVIWGIKLIKQYYVLVLIMRKHKLNLQIENIYKYTVVIMMDGVALFTDSTNGSSRNIRLSAKGTVILQEMFL